MSSQLPIWVFFFFPVAKLAEATRVLSAGIEPRSGLVRSTWVCWGFGGGSRGGAVTTLAGGNEGRKACSAAWKSPPCRRFMKRSSSTRTTLVDKGSHVQPAILHHRGRPVGDPARASASLSRLKFWCPANLQDQRRRFLLRKTITKGVAFFCLSALQKDNPNAFKRAR